MVLIVPRTTKFYIKAFLYLGGAFVLLLGGAIIINAPYNYVGFIAASGDACPFTLHDRTDFYEQLEIGVTVKPNNVSLVRVDFTIIRNETLETYTLNMTITEEENLLPGTNPKAFMKKQVIDVGYGNYTIYVDKIEGADWIDVSYNQLSNNKMIIGIGFALNIVGLVMIIGGFAVSGSLVESESIIVDWGYEDEDESTAQSVSS